MSRSILGRQTPALDACPYVAWEHYNWHDIIQCNFVASGVKLAWNPAVYCIIAASHAVSMYMALELIVRTLLRFKKWDTLYPWAITFAALGLIGEIISCDLTIWILKPANKAWTALNLISSIFCFSGFAFVLYSRLHLVIPPEHSRIRRGLLIMIIVNAFVFHVPNIVSTIIGSYGDTLLGYKLYKHFIYFDIGFAGQDVLLSSVYVYYFWRYLQSSPQGMPAPAKKRDMTTFRLVILAYVVVLLSDVLALVLLGKKLLLARYTILGLIFTMKLNVEYFVLNRLVETNQRRVEYLERGNMSNSVSTVMQWGGANPTSAALVPAGSRDGHESFGQTNGMPPGTMTPMDKVLDASQIGTPSPSPGRPENEKDRTQDQDGMAQDLERQYLGCWEG